MIYGGLGDDFLHGGAGDDAISGAEAMRRVLQRRSRSTDTNPLSTTRPPAKFAAYDADNPWSKIPDFLLNFDAYVVDDATGKLIVRRW